MRIVPFIIAGVVTAALVITLNTRLTIGGKEAPALGSFLSPQHGFWQNAENSNADFTANLKFPGLDGKVDAYLDDPCAAYFCRAGK